MTLKKSLVACIVTMLLVSGCSPETRYRTLSFFFDGVPQPGVQTSEASMGPRSKKKKQQTVSYRSHGPYDAKMCEECHMQGGSNKLLLPVEELCFKCHDLNIHKKHVHGPVASGGCRVCHDPHGSGKPYLLVSEPTTFCFYCHDEVEVKSREVHKDRGDTQCTECHNPHASDEDFMMK